MPVGSNGHSVEVFVKAWASVAHQHLNRMPVGSNGPNGTGIGCRFEKRWIGHRRTLTTTDRTWNSIRPSGCRCLGISDRADQAGNQAVQDLVSILSGCMPHPRRSQTPKCATDYDQKI